MIAQGPEVASSRRVQRPTGGRHRVCGVSSGTAALHVGLLSAALACDEVIVPSFTFAATANSVALTGATPVFADIEPDFFCLDPLRFGRYHRAHQAIMPVHLMVIPPTWTP